MVGLVGRRRRFGDLAGTPDALAGLDIDLYFADYTRGVIEAGGFPVHVPIDVDPADVIERCDALLLAGGTDVDPGRYGRAPETDLFLPEAERDTLELALMDGAVEHGIPTLGICRGLQVVNVHGGGTLEQHVPEHARYDLDPATEIHTVRLASDSRLGSFYGESITVNSLHHQMIEHLADDYRATAWDDSGRVEGAEHESLPIVGVQWHPEMMRGRSTDPIFGWLIDAAVASWP
ncbi:MAG: gamma-glutamyl-gamma-aminobutyrate hydrolase family protein [Actinomycetota bacterium]